MTRRYRKKSFVPVGAVGFDGLGLSRTRGRQLALLRAWSRAAGPVLAAKAEPLGLRGGTLEIRVLEDDESWRRTLTEMLPGIAAAVAAKVPALAIERAQLVSERGDPLGDSVALGEPTPQAEPPRRQRPHREAPAEGEGLDKDRLRRLMQVYLERCSESDVSSGS